MMRRTGDKLSTTHGANLRVVSNRCVTFISDSSCLSSECISSVLSTVVSKGTGVTVYSVYVRSGGSEVSISGRHVTSRITFIGDGCYLGQVRNGSDASCMTT